MTNVYIHNVPMIGRDAKGQDFYYSMHARGLRSYLGRLWLCDLLSDEHLTIKDVKIIDLR